MQQTARAALRYTNDGELAECPCCGSLDVGGAHDTVNCYGCGLQITKPRPLKNAADAWNKRAAMAQSERVHDGCVLIRHALLESIWKDADSGAFCNPDKGELAEVRALLDAAAPSPSKQGGE